MARPDAISARAAATEARLAGLARPAGTERPEKDWARAIRGAALDRLRSMGLPLRRDEYWKYTDPAGLNAAAVPPAAIGPGDELPFDTVERLTVTFTDGVFDAGASDPLAGEGLEIESLAEALSRDIHWAREVFGTLEARGQTPVARPFAALNTALAAEGLVIRVSGAPKPLHIVYRRTSEAGDALVHHVLKLDPGAELTLLESGNGAARLNTMLEAEIGDGARLHHVRVQGRDHERRVATHVFAEVGEGSLFKSFTLAMNGRLTRNEVVIDIAGADAVAHVAGAAVGDGRDFLHDDTVFVTHGAPGCESRQVFKKVLKNGATGVFQGKILVKQVAQKTDGYQISQSMLLDGDSNFLAKPELEIYADDVKCSHGSTSGAIDEEALFYMRSRGVPRDRAEILLVLSFLSAAVQEIEDEAIQADILTRLEGWLIRHRH